MWGPLAGLPCGPQEELAAWGKRCPLSGGSDSCAPAPDQDHTAPQPPPGAHSLWPRPTRLLSHRPVRATWTCECEHAAARRRTWAEAIAMGTRQHSAEGKTPLREGQRAAHGHTPPSSGMRQFHGSRRDLGDLGRLEREGCAGLPVG